MSKAAEVEDVYAAIEESAQLLDVPCSREKVWPILTAFAPFEGGIIFSASAGERHAGDLDLTIQVPRRVGDPYAHALENGLIAGTDHPVGTLLSDLAAHCSVNEYLIDFGVVGGFNKVYVHFPRDLQGVSKLAGIPSMPAAVAENADFFARHGLDDVAMIAIDYRHRTTNLYFPLPEGIEQKTVVSMLRDLGLPEPDEQVLDSVRKTFRVYATLGWDSSRIERISFARSLDLPVVSARVEPEIERFVTGTPYTYPGERFSISIVKWSPDGEWFNVGSYYQFGPLQWEVLKKILT
ncbi:aromatic prenyltransferase [Streptomyces fructofermentans]|uniref:aromatic prenyltransferase n=1 Tax=Streptomyces fructofermentans TaxID=152141 RepID=UPI0033DE26AA